MKNNTQSIFARTFTDTLAIDFSKLIESFPGNAYWKDRNSIVMGCNELQANSLGFASPEDLIGKTTQDLIWKGLPSAEKQRQTEVTAEIDKSVMTSGIAYSHKEFVNTVDGPKGYLINKIPLKDAAGNTVGLISISLETDESAWLAQRTAKKKKQASHQYSLLQQKIPLGDSNSPPLKVLLVEDNQIAKKTAELLFENFCHEIDTAENSIEAIALFEPNKYDLVVTNIGLPDLDGYKLTEQLRKMEKDIGADPAFIVALTTLEPTNIDKKATASGINALLRKPLSVKQVASIANQAYQRKTQIHFAIHPMNTFIDPSQNVQSTKKAIDLEDGAKILGKGVTVAQHMLEDFMSMLPSIRTDLEQAYRENDWVEFQEVVHKFYGGLCYIGVPHLRQAGKELETALVKREDHQIKRLYQRLLDEMSAVEKEFKLLNKVAG